MRYVSAFALMLATVSVASNAGAEWAISRSLDPMTDELSVSTTLTGSRGTQFGYICQEKDKRIYQAAGINAPDADLPPGNQLVRLRFDNGAIEERTLIVAGSRLLLGSSQANDFLGRVMQASAFAYEFTDANGRRFVDSFSPKATPAEEVSILEKQLECLKRGKGR